MSKSSNSLGGVFLLGRHHIPVIVWKPLTHQLNKHVNFCNGRESAYTTIDPAPFLVDSTSSSFTQPGFPIFSCLFFVFWQRPSGDPEKLFLLKTNIEIAAVPMTGSQNCFGTE